MLGVISIITRLSKKIASIFILHGIIQEEDKEVYEYSFELLLSTILNSVAIIVIAILTKRILEATLFVIGFVPLRALAGGYHADTHFRCLLILLFTFSLFLLTLVFLPVKFFFVITIMMILISILLVFILSPVEDSNRPFSEHEKISLKRKSRASILVYTVIVFGLSFLFSNKIFGFSLAFGIFSVSVSLLASVIKNKIKKCINASSIKINLGV